MAADVTALRETESVHDRARPRAVAGVGAVLRRMLLPLASLKLTVVLFAMSIFLVFASTLAQKEHDIWEVIYDWYRVDERKLFSWEFPWIHPAEMLVFIKFQYFFPDSFFPDRPQVDGGLLFPRGWVIGMLMGINLLAAHAVRFTVQARGLRLATGLGLLALGCVVTWLAVESGSSSAGVLDGAIVSWNVLWKFLLMGLATVAFFGFAGAAWLDRRRTIERWSLIVTAAAAASALAYALYYGPEARISGESTRILWQLIKGTAAGLVLLAGAQLVFKKRAGIVVLHAGIGLMFAYEVIVGKAHEERQMSIFEGQSQNWTQDIRFYELVVTEPAPDAPASSVSASTAPTTPLDTEIVVPQKLLHEGARIALPEAPFDVRIVRFYRNSKLRDARPGEAGASTAGLGAGFAVDELQPVKGTDSSGAIDMTSMVVELLEKQTGRSLGTYLTGLELGQLRFINSRIPRDTFEHAGKKYAIELRSKRTYRPYSIKLREVRKDDYLASDKPRNYSSVLEVTDPSRNVSRVESIKMNSPMRFADESFYQHGYNQAVDGRKFSTIQVVENVGWMLPYVSCMIVVVGCTAQFGGTLMRFLNRRRLHEATAAGENLAAVGASAASGYVGKAAQARRAKPAPTEPKPDVAEPESFARRWGLSVAMVCLVAGYTAKTLVVAAPQDDEMNLYAFGELPVAYESRVKPYDSVARSTLAFLSHRQTYKVNLDDDQERSKPAIRWLLDVMTSAKGVNDLQVFRIDNLDVLKALDIKRNRHSRYSYHEIFGKQDAFSEQVKQAIEKGRQGQVGPYEREIQKLKSRVDAYYLLQLAFLDPKLELPTPEVYATSAAKGESPFDDVDVPFANVAILKRMLEKEQAEGNAHPALGVPAGSESWQLYSTEVGRQFYARLVAAAADPAGDPVARAYLRHVTAEMPAMASIFGGGKADNPGLDRLRAVLTAYKKHDVAAFNSAVAVYDSYLVEHPPHEYDRTRRRQEAYLNHAEPFFWCSYYYLTGFLLAAVGWLAWPKQMNRAALATITATFVVHSAALVWRMYVSERPPVINLYSSAVFIGWGAVLFGILFEAVFRLGIGNVIAAVSGFGSLQIAFLLSRQGDTIEALQAVLDTQFWLTTHVVCITLGYAVTYVAGLLGTIYVLRGVLTPSLSPEVGKELARMIYGTLCFALLFSFFGTVLGGLWADDSWGRFWGWDPKENGALIIVLWNALVLHARWDGMVRDRGMAVLAVAGNITTSWSWFGVNQLGVGLHAYGFSQELLNVLVGFVGASLAVTVVGLVPRRWWWSGGPSAATA